MNFRIKPSLIGVAVTLAVLGPNPSKDRTFVVQSRRIPEPRDVKSLATSH